MSRRFPSSIPLGAQRLLLVTSLFLSFHTLFGSDDSSGFILDLHGDWHLDNDNTLLLIGQTVPAGHQISRTADFAKKNPDDGDITVVLNNGQIESRSPKTAHFNDPIKLPSSGQLHQGDGLIHRIIAEVKRPFGNDPERYVPTITRGGDGMLQEAVVSLESDQLNLEPVFHDARKAKYLVRLRRASNDSEPISGDLFEQMTFEWDPNSPMPLTATGLTPGLYVLSLLRSQSEDHEPTGDRAWVLIASPNDFKDSSHSFQTAKELTRQWGESARPGATRAFLRAYLESLSDPSSNSNPP